LDFSTTEILLDSIYNFSSLFIESLFSYSLSIDIVAHSLRVLNLQRLAISHCTEDVIKDLRLHSLQMSLSGGVRVLNVQVLLSVPTLLLTARPFSVTLR
jgi:hypothetical protein